jgi:hypothetical protein
MHEHELEKLKAEAREILRANRGYVTDRIGIAGPLGMETCQFHRERHDRTIARNAPDLVMRLAEVGAFTTDGMLSE